MLCRVLRNRGVNALVKQPTIRCMSELTDNSGRPAAKLKYRNQATWNLHYTLPECLQQQPSRDWKQTLFNDAIHIDKHNKDYEGMFDKLGLVCAEILRSRAVTETDLIYLRSLVHHVTNTRYGYTNRRIATTGIFSEVQDKLKLHSDQQHSRNFSRVILEGPSWWQTLLNSKMSPAL
eukprot:m.21836 g.21836  ORF g.21836 m.21836 type:complete len:177 (-) comp7240_c0_seq1:96-626(-)